MAIVALPLLLALLHATETLRLPVFDRLDHLIYDARLRATMPRTLDDRIVIVDIDEDSLAQVGQWPFGAATGWRALPRDSGPPAPPWWVSTWSLPNPMAVRGWPACKALQQVRWASKRLCGGACTPRSVTGF